MALVPVDHDPFAQQQQLIPVDHNPFEQSYDQIHESMMNNALPATSSNPLAALTAYGANVEKTIPFMHETGSGIAAAFGAGQGNNFGDRYNNLEQATQAMGEAGLKTQPRIETPDWMPDITPTGIGETGAMLMAAPITPGPTKAAEGLWPAVRQGAKWGAGYGTAYGIADGNSFEDAGDSASDRLGHGIAGGLIGVPLGGAFAGAGYKLASALTNTASNTPEDIKFLSGKVENDLHSPQKLASMLRAQKGQPVTLADVAGPNVQSLAEAIAQEPGKGMADAESFLKQRNTEQPSRTNDVIEKHIAPLDFFSRRQASLDALGDGTVSKAYSDAYSSVPKINDPQINEAIDRLVSTPVGKQAWRNASQAAALEGRTLGNVDAVGNMGSMSSYGIDTFQKELNSVIKSERANGNFDKLSPLGTKILGLNKQISSRFGEINPGIQQARNLYGNDASLINAMDAGEHDLWGRGFQGVVNDFHDYTDPEKEAFLSGVARRVSKYMNTQAGDTATANSSNPAAKTLNNANIRERVSAILGEKVSSNLENDLANQANMQTLSNKVLQNSATARRTATQNDLTDASQSFVSDHVSPAANYFANFQLDRPASWIGVTPQKVSEFGASMSADKRQKLSEALAGRLFNPDYSANMKTTYELAKYPAQLKASQAALAKALLYGNGAALTGPTRAAAMLYGNGSQ